jgi:Ca2+/Na+ antiporter
MDIPQNFLKCPFLFDYGQQLTNSSFLVGCWVGLKDAVTAISFVALGTSVPDTFASKVSAVQDKYADNSIGKFYICFSII